MRCVAKDLGLSAQNRCEKGRILQEDGKLHLFILHIFIKGVLHLLPKFSMFYALSQNKQQLFEN